MRLMSAKSHNQLALVIKCQRHHETDLLVTLITRERGKILTVAKGVRKLTSKRRSALEAGNLVHAQLIDTKGWPLLTQTKLVADTIAVRHELAAMRKFLLFLEIIDRLIVAEELSPELFEQILYLRELILHRVSNEIVREHFTHVLQALGYADERPEASINQQVNAILDSQLRSFEYLSVKIE